MVELLLSFIYRMQNVLVKNGYAWHYKKYSKNKTLDQLEESEMEKNLGLWADPAPVAPWEFRHLK